MKPSICHRYLRVLLIGTLTLLRTTFAAFAFTLCRKVPRQINLDKTISIKLSVKPGGS